MAKKKNKSRNKKIKNERRIYHEVVGVLLLGLGFFAFLSMYTASAGIAGSYLKKALMGFFGILGYIMPFGICIIGALVIVAYYKKVNKTKLRLSISSLIFIICIIHIIYLKRFDSSTFSAFVISSYNVGKQGKGAGLILSPLVYCLYKLLGIWGSYIFLVVLFIIDLIVLANLSFKKAVNYVCDKVDSYDRSKKKLKRPFVGENIIIESQEDSSSLEQVTLLNDIPWQGQNMNLDNHNSGESIEQDKESSLDTKNTIDKEKIRIIDFDATNLDKLDNHVSKTDNKGDQALKDEAVQGVELIEYKSPPLSLLKSPGRKRNESSNDKQILANAKTLEDTLNSFGVKAKVLQVSKGPVITRYEIQPAPGVKVSKIVNLADDISLNLAAPSVRIEAPIPGKAAVGVEVPNKHVSPVFMKEVLESEEFKSHPSNLAFALGKDIAGKVVIADIAKMPHLLIAGATGSGKSVCINTMINSIIYKSTPAQVRLIMIDPKVVELNNYNGIPHLLIPVVTDPKKAAGALNWAVQEMVSRYKMFADNGVRDIDRFNELKQKENEETLPQIVVIIDELADLMMVAPNDVEDAICRLAQMARAAGIHLVIATQRPSVDVITGVIKANIPSRIAFAVSSQTDSRTILDMAGAEKLLGKGDMLFYPVGINKPVRVQGAYISEKEVENIVDYIKNHHQTPEYNQDIIEEIAVDKDDSSLHDDCDELLPQAIELVIDAGQASISMLQRRLRVGYARAARLIDEMEIRGIVSGFDGSKPRNVLITREEFEEKYKV